MVEERGLGTEGGRSRVIEIVGSGGRKRSIKNSSFLILCDHESRAQLRASMCIVLYAMFPITDDRYQHRPLCQKSPILLDICA